MKKYIYLAAILSVGSLSAQENKVGINTTEPKTTLTIDALKETTHPAGLQAPRLTRAELASLGDAIYTAEHKGTLIYITDISGGDTNNQRQLITEIGYYYFDGVKWQRAVSTYEYRNLYNRNGRLTGDRTVTQEAKTLDFSQTTGGKVIFQNTDGTDAAPKSPIQIIDGRQGKGKLLASDEHGNAYWEVAAVPIIQGTFKPEGGVPTEDAANTYFYNTGVKITLPEGKYALNLSAEYGFAAVGKNLPDANNPTMLWTTVHLGTNDIPKGTRGEVGKIGISADLTADNAMNTDILAAGLSEVDSGRKNLKGMALIKVGKGGKTFYLYVQNTRRFGEYANTNTGAINYQMKNSFKADGQNTYFYAFRLAD